MSLRETHSGDALYLALDELRRSTHPQARTHDIAWRVVYGFVGTLRPVDDDARQETLLRISRAIASFAGQTAGEAVRWVKTIHARKYIDYVRKDKRDPVAKNLDRVRADDDGTPTVETLASPEQGPSTSALALFSDELFAQVDAYLMQTIPNDAARRHLRRTWTRAAFLRLVHELDSDSIVQELALAETPSKDLVSKWIERGRTVLRETLEAWPADDDRALVIETLHDLLDTRRSDAGRPRINRRKKGAPEDENA